ncbi:Pepco domain-containing protein [Streptomyces zhihengii]|uniref:Pepco domain-containing protein n=1 Tax=Streptomyces zhihengii TaxID=1818004 RepID=UPI0036351CA1
MFENSQATTGGDEGSLETLPFIVSIDDTAPAATSTGPAGDKGLFGRRAAEEGDSSLRDIPVAVLRDSLQRAVDGLQGVLGSITVPEGGMALRQAQVSFEVTASGGIAFVGTSAQVAAKGAITLTFEA